MLPDALALFRDLADRPAADREAYYVEHQIEAGLRAEVESLLRFDGRTGDSLHDYVASAAAEAVRDRPSSPVALEEIHGTARAPSTAAPLTGRRVGVFEIQGLLGAGGMGEVYRARDTRLGRDVAIKILSRALRDEREHIVRFEREARVLASLNHPHIGAVYGLEEVDGLSALVMELVEGEDLAERLGAWAASAGRGARRRPAGGRGARSRTCPGHHPSGSQAGEHQAPAGRRRSRSSTSVSPKRLRGTADAGECDANRPSSGERRPT